MDFLDLARERFSERRFSNEPVEEAKLDAIMEAGRLAPTAENLQPQRVLMVTSPEGLQKMDRCTRCRYGAPAVAVLAYDVRAAAVHPDVVDFGIVDISIVGTHMMLAAQDLGVHSLWVGLIDPSELRRQFNIPRTYRVVSVMDFGYPGPHSRPARLHEQSLPTEELFFRESYDRPDAEQDAPRKTSA